LISWVLEEHKFAKLCVDLALPDKKLEIKFTTEHTKIFLINWVLEKTQSLQSFVLILALPGKKLEIKFTTEHTKIF